MAYEPKGNNGGVRAGAGRKRKVDTHAGAIKRVEKKIADRLPEIADAQIGLALGVNYVDPDTKLVYTTLPDRAAGQYLINRILGAPLSKQEITGNAGGPLEIRHWNPNGSTYDVAITSIEARSDQDSET